MSDLDKILSLAREQIGVAEQPPGSNNVIYNTDYYGGPVQGSGYPWCCSFIWWLFDRCGLSALFCGGQKTAYCPFVVDYARQHGQWVDGDYRPGDLLLYDWDGDGVADHIGLCESTFGQSATAIEGNYQDKVSRVTRSFVGIMGAYRPAYAAQDAPQAPTSQEQPQQSTGPTPGEKYTVRQGDTLWGIAERAYGNGGAYPLILSANKLPGDMIWPGQVLKIPKIGGEQETPQEPTDTCTATLPVLRRGDVSLSVKALQAILAMRGYMLDVDGDYGQATETTVKGFQASVGLDSTGIVNGATWEKLIG